jgi:tRNA threonylcarbamoyladenosine biosynthesis protein TsaB
MILNIETATKNCSVSLAKDGQLIDLTEYAGTGYSHAEKLHVFIDEILRKNKLSATDLQAIAVSMGPGSYTGLRIGVSAAKGMAYALNIPLISVSTLASMARQIKQTDAYIIPMIDARRMEVYSAVFDHKYQMIREVEAEILSPESFLPYLEQRHVYFVGDAVAKTKEIVQHKNAVFTDVLYPSAKEMVELSQQKFAQNDFEDTAYFEPFYLKDFISTVKRK